MEVNLVQSENFMMALVSYQAETPEHLLALFSPPYGDIEMATNHKLERDLPGT